MLEGSGRLLLPKACDHPSRGRRKQSFGDRLAIDLWQEEDYLRRRHNRCAKRAQIKDATRDRVAAPEICGECSSEMDHNPEQGEAHCRCCGAMVTTELRYRDSNSSYRFSYLEKSVIVHETSAGRRLRDPDDASLPKPLLKWSS